MNEDVDPITERLRRADVEARRALETLSTADQRWSDPTSVVQRALLDSALAVGRAVEHLVARERYGPLKVEEPKAPVWQLGADGSRRPTAPPPPVDRDPGRDVGRASGKGVASGPIEVGQSWIGSGPNDYHRPDYCRCLPYPFRTSATLLDLRVATASERLVRCLDFAARFGCQGNTTVTLRSESVVEYRFVVKPLARGCLVFKPDGSCNVLVGPGDALTVDMWVDLVDRSHGVSFTWS